MSIRDLRAAAAPNVRAGSGGAVRAQLGSSGERRDAVAAILTITDLKKTHAGYHPREKDGKREEAEPFHDCD